MKTVNVLYIVDIFLIYFILAILVAFAGLGVLLALRAVKGIISFFC